MKLKEMLWQSLDELLHHKLRTLLTLLGMIFGVGAVIAMLNIGEGAQREALKLIDSMGLRNLIVQGQEYDNERLKEIREESTGLSLRDLEASLDTLPFVQAHSAEKNVKTHDLFSHQGSSDAQVLGVTASHFELASLKAARGRLFDDQDDRHYAQVAVIGQEVAQALFPGGGALGGRLKVNHLWLEVVAVLASPRLSKEEFQGVKLGGERNRIYIPLQTALKKLKHQPLASELDAFRLQLATGVDPLAASQALKHLLDRRHGGVDDYRILVPAQLLAQQAQTQQIFNIVMSCVAGISLLVGGIGIMNIMLATVLERTKEIGLLRAVGARRQDVVAQFMAESFVIACLGGVLGILFGLGLSELIALYSDWTVAWSFWAIALSVTICALIGLLFGVYPAIKASRLDPIQALQSD
ncbi:ABC transporter permease [Gallaecimonas sp. GXIMD4217]|uniref:ABC transporter permease n=1 Tax=Gallaecimonas sp. GXIMD4217 TaxID=3131927 RepID=UPI00311B141C